MRERVAAAGRRIPGEAGIWVFVLGDMTMFAAFFGQFVVDRADDTATFDAAQADAHIAFGAVNTLLLLTGSLFVVWGVHACRSGALGLARRWFLVAFACGGVFLVNKFLEYGDKLANGVDPADNLYYTYFFMFTGLHALHLVIGLVVLGVLIRITRQPALTARNHRTVEIGATYWHLVDLLWIVLFALLYLMA